MLHRKLGIMKIHAKLILFFCVCFTLEGVTSACNKASYNQTPELNLMNFTGWTMVFKLVAGVPGRPATTWTSPFTTFEYALAALNTNNNFKHHYKNRIVQKWSAFAPTEVRLVFYKQGKEEVVLRFNAAKTNNKNWFSQARIIDAPWQNILSEKKNFFAIEGSCYKTGCRDFFINRNYGGCGADQGWFYVGNSRTCKWESRLPTGVKLIYSKTANHVNYNSYSHVGTADVFAVYLR